MNKPKANNNLKLVFLIVILVRSAALSAGWVEQFCLPDNITHAYAIDACDENTAAVSLFDSLRNRAMILATTDGGDHWRETFAPAIGYDIEIVDSNHIWICSDGIYRTIDGGNDWSDQFIDTTLTKKINYIEMFDLTTGVGMGDCIGDTRGTAIILQTDDDGRGWSSVNDSAFGGTSDNLWRKVDFIDKYTGYFSPATPKYSMFKTVGGGNFWWKTGYRGTSQILTLKFYNKKIGIITDWKGLKRTIDGGETWRNTGDGSPYSHFDIEFSPDDAACVWLIGDECLFFSTDSGKTWQEKSIPGLGKSAGNPGSDIIFISPTHGWLLSQKAIYRTIDGGIISGLHDDKSKLPLQVELRQNYPNPFNPATTIEYKIHMAGQVKIEIFDVSGRWLKTLTDAQHRPGYYQVSWDASDYQSGIYLYRISAGNSVCVRKCILLK